MVEIGQRGYVNLERPPHGIVLQPDITLGAEWRSPFGPVGRVVRVALPDTVYSEIGTVRGLFVHPEVRYDHTPPTVVGRQQINAARRR